MRSGNHVFTGKRWVDLDRREANRRFWGRVGLILLGAVSWIVIAIAFNA